MKKQYRRTVNHYSNPLIAESLIEHPPYRKAIEIKRYKGTPYRKLSNKQYNSVPKNI